MGNIFSCCAPRKERHTSTDAPERNSKPPSQPVTSEETTSSPADDQRLVFQVGPSFLDYPSESSESASRNSKPAVAAITAQGAANAVQSASTWEEGSVHSHRGPGRCLFRELRQPPEDNCGH